MCGWEVKVVRGDIDGGTVALYIDPLVANMFVYLQNLLFALTLDENFARPLSFKVQDRVPRAPPQTLVAFVLF